MICQSCSFVREPTARYCSHCGSRLLPPANLGADFRSVAWRNDNAKSGVREVDRVEQPPSQIDGAASGNEFALRELQKTREAFRLITETIREVFYIADPSITGIEYISPGYETIWGRSRQSLYNEPRSFLDSVHPEDLQVALSMLENHRRLQSFECQYRVVRPDGEIRWVRDRGFPIKDESGAVIKYVGVAQDISDLVLAQEQVVHFRDELAHLAQMAAMGEFSAGLAHELNQPLSSIAIDAYALRDLYRPGGDRSVAAVAADLAARIETQSLRAGDIVRGLRATVQRQPPTRSPASLQHLLDKVHDLLSSGFHHAQVEFASRLNPRLPDVVVDSIQIQQVLFNLLQNSVEAMCGQSSPRHLVVFAEPVDGQMVQVRIRDTGPGLAEEIRSNLFTPFTTTKADGMGFGLAISRRIVAAHGGVIDVSPQAASGVEVTFTLPTKS